MNTILMITILPPVLQLIIALGIYNVWLLRFSQKTAWRGGKAASMKEEFAAYGLPETAVYVVGFFKLLFATFLLAGLWLPALVKPGAAGMALLMLGAVAMHIKVKDPVRKSLPAASLLALSLLLLMLEAG